MANTVFLTIQIPTDHMLKWLRIAMAEFLFSECRLSDCVAQEWAVMEEIMLNGSTSFYEWVMNGYGLCRYKDLDKIFCLNDLSDEVEYDYEALLILEGLLAADAAYDVWDFCINDAADSGEIKANLIIFMNENFESEYTDLC